MKSLSTREREVNYAFINFREVDEEFADGVCSASGETEMHERAGHNGVCNSSGSFGGDCNPGNCCVSSEAAGVVGRDNKWHGITLDKRVFFEFTKLEDKTFEQKAQSSVEFAIVAVVLVLIVVGLAAILGKLTDGTFLSHAIVAASHNITDSVSGVVDAFCY